MLTTPNRSIRSQYLLGLLIAVCLFGCNVWAVTKMLASQQSLSDAAYSLTKSKRLVSEIQTLQNRPRIASLEQETPTGMSNRVKRALQNAGIPKTEKETPGVALQKGQTNYKERLIEIKVNGVSMQQVVQFCQVLEDPSEGLTVRDLKFSASNAKSESAADLWDVTVTLSQLIYSVSL